MKATIYIRVSTTQQIDKDSLKTQEERLKYYCKDNGYTIYKIYKDEEVSAKNTKDRNFLVKQRATTHEGIAFNRSPNT